VRLRASAPIDARTRTDVRADHRERLRLVGRPGQPPTTTRKASGYRRSARNQRRAAERDVEIVPTTMRPPKLIVGPNCCHGDNSLPRSTSSHRRPAGRRCPPPRSTPNHPTWDGFEERSDSGPGGSRTPKAEATRLQRPDLTTWSRRPRWAGWRPPELHAIIHLSKGMRCPHRTPKQSRKVRTFDTTVWSDSSRQDGIRSPYRQREAV